MDVDGDQGGDGYFQENARDRVNGGGTGSTREILTRVELELAFSSEKLLNLEMLLMEVARRAADIELLISGKESSSCESVEKAFEFDILHGIIDSEVKEFDNFISFLQMDIEDVAQKVSQEESADKIKEKLSAAMASLKQMRDVIAEIKKETFKVEKTIDFSHGKAGTTVGDGYENGHISYDTTMQTEDQRRNVLQKLEKSIASELDLEKKLSDSRSIVEELKLKLHHLEQESYFLEDSIEAVSERMFAAENASELFFGTSKELMGYINTVQFHLSASMLREQENRVKLEQSLEKLSAAEITSKKLQEDSDVGRPRDSEHNHMFSNSEILALKGKAHELEEQLRESDSQLRLAKSSAEASQEEQNMLQSQLSTSEGIMKDLEDNVSRAESRAKNAEARCMQLTKANMELSEELSSLRSQSDKAGFLERKLKESDTQLEHAKASVDAIVEQQNMLKSTMSDMEHMIEDLKGKVLKAETRAENAESKCTLLTDTNFELSEELSFLRTRVEGLENSLRQANHMKASTAKDISIRTKIIADLVAKLALERERLHLQIVTLTKKNKMLAQKGKGNASEDKTFTQMVSTAKEDEIEYAKLGENIFPESSLTQTMGRPTAGDRVGEEEAETAVPAEDESGAEGALETVRSIEPTLLNWKYFFPAFLVLLAAAIVYVLYHEEGNTA